MGSHSQSSGAEALALAFYGSFAPHLRVLVVPVVAKAQSIIASLS
ncbi:MAG: hypothetical protein ACI9O0_000907 [Paracoccaceae bacterium]|jgi:hypothetical protein